MIPGTSCLATIVLSLRDKSHSPIEAPYIYSLIVEIRANEERPTESFTASGTFGRCAKTILDLQNACTFCFVLSVQISQNSLKFAVRLEEIQPWIFGTQYRIGKSSVSQEIVQVPISIVEAVLKSRSNSQVEAHPTRRLSGR